VSPTCELAPCPRAPFAFDDRHLVLLHQPLDAAVELPGDLAAAVDDLGEVEASFSALRP
jgi:hypothetical protein